jgi:hypothetical protein
MGEILRLVELGWYAPKAEFAPFWWRECLSTQPVKRLEFALRVRFPREFREFALRSPAPQNRFPFHQGRPIGLALVLQQAPNKASINTCDTSGGFG